MINETTVNTVCFTAQQFLNLLEVNEEGENLYFIDISDGVKFMIWIGETREDYKIIRSSRDPEEWFELMKGMCPLFGGLTK